MGVGGCIDGMGLKNAWAEIIVTSWLFYKSSRRTHESFHVCIFLECTSRTQVGGLANF
jgi:hypothetical protein